MQICAIRSAERRKFAVKVFGLEVFAPGHGHNTVVLTQDHNAESGLEWEDRLLARTFPAEKWPEEEAG